MRVLSVSLRDFRCYERAAAPLGGGLTVVCGDNGAGKTNLLEGLYFGCTGRSCRTSNERELVRFGEQTTRVIVNCEDSYGAHELTVGLTTGEPKRMTADGVSLERMLDAPHRPLVSVFLPDRLELIKGVPAVRRAHLDQLVTALWPARAGARRAYAQALAQRNALIYRIRAGIAGPATLESWDQQLARTALELMADRREAIGLIAAAFPEVGQRLGLDGDPAIAYRPRSKALSEDELLSELRDRRDSDLDRGFSDHGPHRDEVSITRAGRPLRTYGSQGQQRLGLLALLLAERSVIAGLRDAVPLMLLDDVMSELDRDRRAALIELLATAGGQALITTTDSDHVPAHGADVARLDVYDCQVQPLFEASRSVS
jgi:DNA replication and repair protein RecF